MDTPHVDSLTRALSEAGTRRRVLGKLAALATALGLNTLDAPEGAAKRKGHGRRRSHRPGKGKANRKGNRKGKHKNKGTTSCSRHSDCGANALCLSDGSCQSCSVTCTGTAEACGVALQTALDAGGTVYICPGTYQGGFVIEAAVSVVGAGEGDDPASNTILDGNNAFRVVQINEETGTVELARLRLTRGDAGEDEHGSGRPGGGVQHQGTTLRMRHCTVTSSTASGGGGISSDDGTTLELTRCTVSENTSGGGGGGIDMGDGTMILTDCLVAANDAPIGAGIATFGLITLAGSTEVRGNRAVQGGGGIFVGGGTLEIAATCRVTENRAQFTGSGGGIFNSGGTVTLLGDEVPSLIVVDNCHENCAGNVPNCTPGGSCPE